MNGQRIVLIGVIVLLLLIFTEVEALVDAVCVFIDNRYGSYI